MGSPSTLAWRLLVDRGGTFTDVVALSPDGTRRVLKLISGASGGDAVLAALREVTGLADPRGAIGSLRLGTTLATNALLERKGERTVIAITDGLGDLLEIGTQQRPDLFALRIEKPAPLHAAVIEVSERVLADGTVRCAPDADTLRRQLAEARAAGARSLAIAFVHSFAFPAHEQLVAELAREVGFEHVVLSSDVAEGPGLLARAETAALDAALTPLLARQVAELRAALGPAPEILVMQSSGRLARAESVRARDAVLSGPAGGVIALADIARGLGLPRVLGVDMGGTSTDVSRWSAHEGLERVHERVVSGLRVRAEALDVVTVAAGGGSILSRVGGRMVVGPESAGADPGPACHGRGGPPTVTDANVVLGRVRPAWFPRCFGARGDEPLDADAARAALRPLAEALGLSVEAAAAGAVRIANEAMAQAIRQVSVARGHDPREHALVPFGGAGAQHACALADALGASEVIVHPLAGVLSALGLGLADAGRSLGAAVLAPLGPDGLERARSLVARLESDGRAGLEADGFAPEAQRVVATLVLRHAGALGEIDVPFDPRADAAAILRDFDERHQRAFGFVRSGLEIEIVAVRVEVTGVLDRVSATPLPRSTGAPPVAETARSWWHDGGALAEQAVSLYRREDLRAEHEIEGPAIIAESISTIVVEPGWTARVADDGCLRITRSRAPAVAAARADALDAVGLELFGNRFMAIAEEMGEALRRTSVSPNIKERLDFSCAVFTDTGDLVANAPHVPVHLGAMGETVRALLASRGRAGMRPGLVLLSNDPFHGGSHLPDVTVVSPVFVGDELAFFVACRGHHADIGGTTPGSMPPDSRHIDEEGVRLHDVALVEDGRLREREVVALLSAGPHPVRGIPERMADFAAQAAANALGARRLAELVEAHGLLAVRAAMRGVEDDAAAAVRELLASLPQGVHRFADAMDDGTRVEVAITVDAGRAVFDFAGTGPQHEGNLNAPRAITVAAVLYAVRCLVGRRIPLNAGCLEPLEIRVPRGTLLSPEPPAAVAGGNVETSMRIADVVLAALGALAASQGTMNNVTFGDATFGYYETICGGAGAGPGFAGASAVHSHLTNTRITDVEVLERRHPVMVRELSVRRGSGGAGRWRGGDGAVRAIEFLAPAEAAILSQRRVLAPFGLAGGGSGARGANRVVRRDGRVDEIGGSASTHVEPGDVLVIETPGGGGYGAAPDDTSRDM